jgi:hypothetical protein
MYDLRAKLSAYVKGMRESVSRCKPSRALDEVVSLQQRNAGDLSLRRRKEHELPGVITVN